MPGAISCPVLNDDERERIGTIYKQVSAFDAKKLGAALVSRNIARHLEESLAARPRDWKPLVYCWRGGNRSEALAHVLAQIGWAAGQLDGGYKAYRRHVVAELETLPSGMQWRPVCGKTGTGKSRLLNALDRIGAQVLDLEALAHHRGSVLGCIPGEPQPAQKAFESAIWDCLRRFDRERPVFVESESSKIGRLRVPESLLSAMWKSDCLVLEAELAVRVPLLTDEYRHFCADPTLLGHTLAPLAALHGAGVLERWVALCASNEVPELVAEMLEKHYDPAYQRSIDKHYPRLVNGLRIQVTNTCASAMDSLARQIVTSLERI